MITFGTIVTLLFLFLLSLPSSIFAAWTAPGLSYYEKPGEQPITTPYYIATSSSVNMSGNSKIVWPDGSISTSAITNSTQLQAANILPGLLPLGVTSQYSLDSGKLNGQTPTYYATQSELTLVRQSTSTAGSGTMTETDRQNIYTDTTTLRTDLNATALSTGTLQTQISNTALSTGTINGRVDAVILSTVTIGSAANEAAAGNHNHTGTYAAYAIGIDTGTLRTDVNGKQAAGDYALNRDTGIVAAANVTAGALPSTVIASSIAVASVYEAAISPIGWTAVLAMSSTATFITSLSTQQVSKDIDTAFIISSVTISVIGAGTAEVRFFVRNKNTWNTTAGTAILTAAISSTAEAMVGGVLSNTAVAANECIVAVVDAITGGAITCIKTNVKGTR